MTTRGKTCLSERVKVSEQITGWREWRGLTKAELARRIGVSSAAVSQWEKGDNDPSVESTQKVCVALEITESIFWTTPPATDRSA